MKIMLAPDLHCYPTTYSRIEPDGQHSRLKEWRHVAGALVDLALSDPGVGLVVFPGDLFNTPRPSPQQILAVADVIVRLTDNKRTVVAMAGNHDAPAYGTLGPLSILAHIGHRARPVVPDKPTCISVLHRVGEESPADPVKTVEICIIPWARMTGEEFLSIARALRAGYEPEQYKVLVAHITVTGARTSTGHVMCRHDTEVSLADLLALDFDAYLLGHVHKPQVLSTRPFVAYAGALLRNDFGEESDSRGCFVYDTDTGKHTWRKLPAREFKTVDLNAMGFDVLSMRVGLVGLVEGCIVRVVYRATEEEARQVDHAALIRALYDAGAHYVAGVYPEVIRSERKRATAVTEYMDPVAAFRQWLASQNLSTDAADRLVARLKPMLQQVLQQVKTGGIH